MCPLFGRFSLGAEYNGNSPVFGNVPKSQAFFWSGWKGGQNVHPIFFLWENDLE